MTLRISSESTEYVKVPVRVKRSGTEIDPTEYEVEMGYSASSTEEPDTWYPASWESVSSRNDTRYYARVLTGPAGDVELENGTYWLWVKITATPEIPVHPAGPVVVI